jgi:myo-inositol-1(or 4)-monophosphatase
LVWGAPAARPVENYTRTIARVINAGMEYRRFGAGALMLAHVATGQVHAYYEEHMNSWDALAGMLIIVEAGGVSNAFLADDGLLNGNLVLAGCVDVQARLSALLVVTNPPRASGGACAYRATRSPSRLP